MEQNYYLVYIHHSGSSIEGDNSYDFIFAKDPSVVWGDGWHVKPSSICSPSEKKPHSSTYDLVKRITTHLNFGLSQDNSYYAMQDCMDGIISLAYEDVTGYEEYPIDRLVFNYGEIMENVEKKLKIKDISLKDI